ncbi:hypothetical protein NDU88_006565 [Pleurodeles waltl]|uniref:TIR domain-containing protein n=1 Tax=Pleurodeles waltl TaxID=8319 RepID=A0AAV7MZL4_PLEWA|nr:hypothetical protein NDU88_006565 [Pleurodeles waltl]
MTSKRNITSLISASLVMYTVHIVWATLPRFFPCDDTKNYTSVNCRRRDLEQVPPIKSPNVIEIDLYKNKLVLIANDSFLGVPNLERLNLSWNCVPRSLQPDREPCKLTIDQNAFVELHRLETLHLASNSLTVIPRLPSNLKELNLEMNNIIKLEYQNMSGIFHLKELYLGMNCYYQNPCYSSLTFTRDLFTDATSLELLSLKFNNLTSIPLGLPSTLTSLDLGENKIPELRPSDFDNLTNLKYLDLRWNCQRCDHAALPCFPCSNNSALQIHDDAFRNLSKLKELNLRGNSLRDLPDIIFEPLTNLQSLELSDNFLALVIASGTLFSKLPRMQNLSLNYNYEPLNTFPKLTLSHTMKDMRSLRYISLNGYFFRNLDESGIEPLLSLPNLQYITFRTNFIENVNLTLFDRFKYSRLIDLSENILTLSKSCTASQVRKTIDTPLRLSRETTLAELYNSVDDNRRDADSDEHPPFYFSYPACKHYHKTLDLSFNNIKRIDPEDFRDMKDVECLNLSYNYINQRLNGSQFSYLTSLKLLDVANNRNNKIKLIDENSFSDVLLSNLRLLDVSGNPLKCTCEAHWFIQFLKTTKIAIEHVSNGMICDAPDSKRGQYLFSIDPRSCQDIYGHLAFLVTTSLAVFVTVLPVLKKLYGWDIWYGAHILKALLRKGYSSCPSIDGYDAFIAFDSQQYAITDWVYNELVLRLEEKGSTQFRLCLEERDWVAGKSRIENLCDAVYKSKKTIFILGADGFASGLLRQTFFIAQQRLLDEKLDVVILVLLESRMKMSKYLQARKRVCKRSIIQWPCNPKGQPYFWHSLRVLLAQDSRKWYDSKIRSSIDG